jgi:cytochrome b561
MSARELTAWAMILLSGGIGACCLLAILNAGLDAPPQPAVLAAGGAAIAGAIALEVLLSIFLPRQSDAAPDERERMILARAGHWSGLVFLFGVLPALGHYAMHANGNVMFNVIVLSLCVAAFVEYGAQIVLFRR